MKTALTTIVALLLVGCAATNNQHGAGSSFGKILTPQRVQAIATLASFAGCRADLQSHPERRPAYVEAQKGLANLMGQSEWNPDAAAVVLSQSSIGGLHGSEGAIAIAGGLMLTDALGLGTFDARRSDHAVALITGLESGLRRALSIPNAARSFNGSDDLAPVRSAAEATRDHPTI